MFLISIHLKRESQLVLKQIERGCQTGRDRDVWYSVDMTRQLETVIKTVRGLSEHHQDELAELMTQALQPSVKYTTAQMAVIEASIAQSDAGEFVSDERIEQVFSRYRAV